MLDRYAPGGEAVRNVAEGASLHSQDMRPSVIVLGQEQSAGVTAGMFQRTDTGEEFEALQVVPLVVRASRLKWPAGRFSRDMLPECWSDDGIVGSSRPIKGEPPRFPGEACHGCDFFTATPWAVDRDEGWCLPGYNVLLMDAETYEVYLMRLRGSAAKVARHLAARGVFQKAVVSLSAELVQTPTGTWYQLKSKTERRLDEDDLSLIASMYRDFAGSAVEGDEQAEDKRDVSPSAPRDALPADHRPRVDRRKFEGVTPELDLPF